MTFSDNKGKTPLDYVSELQRQILLETKPGKVEITEQERECVTQSLIDNQVDWTNEYNKYINSIVVPTPPSERSNFFGMGVINKYLFFFNVKSTMI